MKRTFYTEWSRLQSEVAGLNDDHQHVIRLFVEMLPFGDLDLALGEFADRLCCSRRDAYIRFKVAMVELVESRESKPLVTEFHAQFIDIFDRARDKELAIRLLFLDAIRQLPARQREAFDTVFCQLTADDLNYSAGAREMDIVPSVFDEHLGKAMVKLRKILPSALRDYVLQSRQRDAADCSPQSLLQRIDRDSRKPDAEEPPSDDAYEEDEFLG